MKSVARRVGRLAWIGAAFLWLLSAPAPGQPRSLLDSTFQPTIEDVAARHRSRQFRRQSRRAISAPSCVLSLATSGRHHHHRNRRAPSLSDRERDARATVRHRRRPRRLHLGRSVADHAQVRVAGLGAAAGDDRAPALSSALHGRRTRQSARRPRHVSRQNRLPHPWHQRAGDHRARRFIRAVSALSTTTWSTSTIACRSARVSSCGRIRSLLPRASGEGGPPAQQVRIATATPCARWTARSGRTE